MVRTSSRINERLHLLKKVLGLHQGPFFMGYKLFVYGMLRMHILRLGHARSNKFGGHGARLFVYSLPWRMIL